MPTACADADAARSVAPVESPPPVSDQPNAAVTLHQIFDDAWAHRLEVDPLFASSVGDHRADDRLPDITAEAVAREHDYTRQLLTRIDAVDGEQLSRADQISRDIFRAQLLDGLTSYEFRAHEMALTNDSGFHISFAYLPGQTTARTVQDYENYIARLRDFPRYAAESTELLRQGIAHNMVLPAVVLEGYDVTISTHVVSEPEASVFWKPFASMPATIGVADKERLLAAGRAAIMEAIVPAYQRFGQFMRDEYRPRARPSIGASALPRGREYYAHLVREFTTLDVTPEAVHRIGLDEVARILGEMHQVMREVGFAGDLQTFLEFLRTDPQFYAKTPEELLKYAAYLAKRMDAKLPSLFYTLPRLPYGVAPVPDHLAPKYTSGRYVEPAAGSSEPGYYWVNTYALDSRPLYTLEALTLHEAVPGHHLQMALARELDNLPKFRRFLYLSAFGEGWGLYSERLGLEAGFYTDPYANFGRLTFEMWRACRLVVDTGIHAMNWTREQAVAYMAEHTALSLHDIRTEVDRYISWPGQAVSYKMGELTIRRLRREAETALGAQFDVRQFHDVVLKNGAVPLPILEQEVARYVADTLATDSTARLSPS